MSIIFEPPPPLPEIKNEIFSGMILQELECGQSFEDMYLLLLLRRYCKQGAFENFDYLLKSKVFSREDHTLLKILADYKTNGLTLLHYAAEVGSTDIFKTLIKACPQLSLYDAAHSITVLHVACKNKRYDMCAFLLSDDKYKHLLQKRSSRGCSAAHFTAVDGSIQILKLLESKKLDITTVTNNGLNVIDIACIYNHTAMCTDLIKRSQQNQLSISLDKSNARG